MKVIELEKLKLAILEKFTGSHDTDMLTVNFENDTTENVIIYEDAIACITEAFDEMIKNS